MEENKHYTGDIKAESLSQLSLKVFQALCVCLLHPEIQSVEGGRWEKQEMHNIVQTEEPL